MLDLWTELQRAIKRLWGTPGFALTALVTLALGIGTSLAIVALVQAVLLDPLPYPEAHRLVMVQESTPDPKLPRFSLSAPNFYDYQAGNTTFEAIAAQRGESLGLWTRGDEAARNVQAWAATWQILQVFGVDPLHGRGFEEADDRPDAAPVLLLGYDLWQELGGELTWLDREVQVDGRPTRIVGILPPGFLPRIEAMVPLAVDPQAASRENHVLIGLGRLRPETTLEAARLDLSRVAEELATAYPTSNSGWGAVVDPLHGRLVESVRGALWMLLTAVGMLLLIACTNVANLTLARGATRQREIALRRALGADGNRLRTALLSESLVLALAGGAMGVVLARRIIDWLLLNYGQRLPDTAPVDFEGRFLVMALILSMGTVFLFGWIPLHREQRRDLAGPLKDGDGRIGAGPGRRRLRWTLVVVEVALTLVLLVTSGLLLRTFADLLQVSLGFDPDPVWIADTSLAGSSYDEVEARSALHDELQEGIVGLDGVEAVGLVRPMPLWKSSSFTYLFSDAAPTAPQGEETVMMVRFVTPGFFSSLDIPVLDGEVEALLAGGGVLHPVVLSQGAAEAIWPGEEALGRRLTLDRPSVSDRTWHQVVGVVGDVRWALDQEAAPALYRPLRDDRRRNFTVVVRTHGGSRDLEEPVGQIIRRLDPALPLSGQQPARDLLPQSLATLRFSTTLLVAFAVLSLMLAGGGVFGVVSYLVHQQQRELGVRMALGAEPRHILSHVLVSGLSAVAVGVVLGLLGSVFAGRLLHHFEDSIHLRLEVVFGAVLLLGAVASLAHLLPVLRALRVEPRTVLRDE